MAYTIRFKYTNIVEIRITIVIVRQIYVKY